MILKNILIKIAALLVLLLQWFAALSILHVRSVSLIVYERMGAQLPGPLLFTYLLTTPVVLIIAAVITTGALLSTFITSSNEKWQWIIILGNACLWLIVVSFVLLVILMPLTARSVCPL